MTVIETQNLKNKFLARKDAVIGSTMEVPEAQRLAALYNLGQMNIPIEPRLMLHKKVSW